MLKKTDGLASSPEAEATIRRTGATIRARRKEIGLTLNDVAERTGVSVSMLSMLERGVAGASIGTLVAVSSALRVQMYDLFEEVSVPEQLLPVVKRADQTEVETGEGVLRRVALHSLTEGLEMVVNEYQPHTASGDKPVHHEGREYGIVIEGSLVVDLNGERHILDRGDAIRYDSALPHRISNVGEVKARAVWVNLQD